MFAAIERLHVEGNDDVRNLAAVGFLESLQGLRGGIDPERDIKPWLLPASARSWEELIEFWRQVQDHARLTKRAGRWIGRLGKRIRGGSSG